MFLWYINICIKTIIPFNMVLDSNVLWHVTNFFVSQNLVIKSDEWKKKCHCMLCMYIIFSDKLIGLLDMTVCREVFEVDLNAWSWYAVSLPCTQNPSDSKL